MQLITLVAACISSKVLSCRAHVGSELQHGSLPGEQYGLHREHHDSQKGFSFSCAPPAACQKADPYERVGLAMLLVGSVNPAAAWQIAGHGCNALTHNSRVLSARCSSVCLFVEPDRNGDEGLSRLQRLVKKLLRSRLVSFGRTCRDWLFRPLMQDQNKTITGSTTSVRILLLRHGQGFHQLREDVPDPLLTPAGQLQARSWALKLADSQTFGGPLDLVLVSPLSRTLQTACLAFAQSRSCERMEICRHARELYWDDVENELGSLETIQNLITKELRIKLGLFRKRRRLLQSTLKTALVEGPEPFPETERDSLNALVQELKQRAQALSKRKPEVKICVVCHWGVIDRLCGADAENCEIVECKFSKEGENERPLKVVETYKAPGGPRTKWMSPDL